MLRASWRFFLFFPLRILKAREMEPLLGYEKPPRTYPKLSLAVFFGFFVGVAFAVMVAPHVAPSFLLGVLFLLKGRR